MSSRNEYIEAWGELQRLGATGLACRGALDYFSAVLEKLKNKTEAAEPGTDPDQVRPAIAYLEATIPINSSEETGVRQAKLLINLRLASLIPDEELMVFLTILNNYHVREMEKILKRQEELQVFLRTENGQGSTGSV